MNITTRRLGDRRDRAGTAVSTLAWLLGLACAALALSAGSAYRAELLSLGAAFQQLRWATYGAIARRVRSFLKTLAKA